MRHAYAIRMSFSDPAYFPEVTAGAVADLISGTYIDRLRSITLDDDVLHMSQYGGDKWGLVHDDDLNRGQLTYTEEGNDNRRRLSEAGQSHRELRGFQYLEDHGTTHVSIVDKDGNAVTYTTTINTYFGSGVASPSTGIIFNSQVRPFTELLLSCCLLRTPFAHLHGCCHFALFTVKDGRLQLSGWSKPLRTRSFTLQLH